MSNDITIGNAFHKVGEVAHVNEYCTKDNKPIEDDIKTRIAYILVSNIKKSVFVKASFESFLRLKEYLNTHVHFVHYIFNNLFALNSSQNLFLQKHFSF
ncbi:hypothetical protein [Arcobacter sp. CECT 8985]|uniref:hypothetical protein n=1 Tax=Arcobacter sp. CECT 8985 TaxID=1935424 RepID=UPI00100A3275|nr:hypothetical protein [Arcobacter sp. CECT 8985]RXJ83035.1 hypothetical protein CRU93_14075 [Arcobacter sp. CECT 8985]